MRRTLLAVAVVLTVLAGGLATAWAQSNRPNRITGCLSDGGQLTKFDTGSSPTSACAAGETEVVLHKRGRRGRTGPAGAAGSVGPKGDSGQDGERGAAGQRGRKGDDGSDAPAGMAGSAFNSGGQTSTPQKNSQSTFTVLEKDFTIPADGYVSVIGSFNHLPNNWDSESFWVKGWVTVNRSCSAGSSISASGSYSIRQWHSLTNSGSFSVSEGANTVRLCLSGRSVTDSSWILEHDDGNVTVMYAPQQLVLN